MMTTWTSPAAVAVRDTLTRLAGKLAPSVALRGLDAIYGWQPPAAVGPRSQRHTSSGDGTATR